MAELDKKIIKTQTDLVHQVLEAVEKGNLKGVDTIISNAVKTLKMSRFKPDLITCLSLTYLARIKPKIFLQSVPLNDLFKSLLRRDAGPANIKVKNDIVLPVLSANILLACCDSSEVRTLILQKIKQWLGTNQKTAEIVQHLLATICIKCQEDQQTITTLVDIRHHWLQYLNDNFETSGPVPSDLCTSIRRLLHSETNCESFVTYLNFLIKHDSDINGLVTEMSKFVIDRPISLKSMLTEDARGMQLYKTILRVYVKLFTHLKNESPPTVKIKVEGEKIKLGDDSLYVKLPNSSKFIALSRTTFEAVLTLLSLVETQDDCIEEFNELLEYWQVEAIYEDFDLSTPYNLPDRLRKKLIHSSNDRLTDLSLHNADVGQLVKLLLQFGHPLATIKKILKKIDPIKDPGLIKLEIHDMAYFSQLMEFYSEIGALDAAELKKRLVLS